MRFLGSLGADRGTLGGSETRRTKGIDICAMRDSQIKGGRHRDREEDGSGVRKKGKGPDTK